MLAFQVRPVALEEGDGDEAALAIDDADAPGLVGGARPLVIVDDDREGGDLAINQAEETRGFAADQAVGLEEQHVADEGAGQLLDQRRDLGPDALEGRDRGEQREETLRTH